MACVYGNLTPRLRQRLAPDASLDVVDILPIQLKNLRRKLPADERVALLQGDSSSLACADASYDQVLLFFLLHEQPEHVRRATLAEAMRVVRPGGKIVIVDYHRPVRLASAAPADDRRVPQARAVRDGPVGERDRGFPAPAPGAGVDRRSRPTSAGCTRSWC